MVINQVLQYWTSIGVRHKALSVTSVLCRYCQVFAGQLVAGEGEGGEGDEER